MTSKWGILVYATVHGLLYGAGVGALYGTFMFPVFGTVYGLVIGSAAGVVGGSACGIAIGLVAGWLEPETHPQRYQWIIMVMSAVITAVTTGISLLVFMNPNDIQSIQYFQLPVVIAALTAAFAGWCFIRREKGKTHASFPGHPDLTLHITRN